MKAVYFDSQIPEKIAKEKFCFPEGIMMENAASSLQNVITDACNEQNLLNPCVLIICGSGNNGGDGIALARRIFGKTEVYVFCVKNPKTPEALVQLKMAKSLNVPFLSESEFNSILEEKKVNIIVDCLFGTGFSGVPDEKSSEILLKVNSYDCIKIACDIPSGINKNGFVYKNSKNEALVFNADYTVTMGALKTALFSDAAKDFCGKIICAELGISEKVFNSLEKPSAFLLELSDINFPFRKAKSSHKGTFGHAYVIPGEKPGAGLIAATSALEFGCGLSTVCDKFSDFSKIKIPMDLMYSSEIPNNVSAILLGSGFGRNQQNMDMAWDFIKQGSLNDKCSFVFDADIFYYQKLPLLLQELKNQQVILTPHPKELFYLLKLYDIKVDSVEEVIQNRFEFCKLFSEKNPNCVLVSKGAITYICHQNQIFICDVGSVALAKAGSGDVLAGMCLSLLAQGHDCVKAAQTAVYAHGIAASKCETNYSLIPSILIDQISSL